MIQRIQTIFLFLVAAAMIAMISLMPIWGAITPDQTKKAVLWAYQLKFENAGVVTYPVNPIAILILGALAALVALISIFMYKNRLRQMQLGMLNSLLIGGTLVASVLYINQGLELFGETIPTGGYRTGFWMPVVALLFNFLSNRFIRRDDKIVRESNRLR